MEEDQFRGYGGDGEHVYKDGVAKLRNILGGGRVAMLTTADETGALRSRPMVVQKIDDDGYAWLVTDESSAKVHEVRNEYHVNLAWLRPVLGRWLSVTGRATVSRDREKLREVWDPMLQAWFPNGVDDPNICLLKVKLDEAVAWDAPLGNVLQITKLAGTLLGKGGRGGEQARDTIVIRSRQSLGDTAGIFGTAGGSMGTARKGGMTGSSGGGGLSGSGMGGGGTTPGGFGGGAETRGRAGRGATAKAGRGVSGETTGRASGETTGRAGRGETGRAGRGEAGRAETGREAGRETVRAETGRGRAGGARGAQVDTPSGRTDVAGTGRGATARGTATKGETGRGARETGKGRGGKGETAKAAPEDVPPVLPGGAVAAALEADVNTGPKPPPRAGRGKK